MKPLILLNVEKQIGSQLVLQLDRLEIEPGCTHVFVGNNGSGKTTLFHLIAGMIHADSGSINRFDGAADMEWKHSLSYMPQELGPQSYFSLREVAHLEMVAYKDWDKERFDRLVTLFELPLTKKLETFSVGMKKKAMTALALSRPSKLLLMDEPLAGVDISGQEQLKKEWISYLEADEQRTILFSTHSPSEVGEMADYIHFIKDGNLEGPYEKDLLTTQFAYLWVEQAPDLTSLPGVIQVQQAGPTAMLFSEDCDKTEEALQAKCYQVQQIQAVGIADILRAKLESRKEMKG